MKEASSQSVPKGKHTNSKGYANGKLSELRFMKQLYETVVL